MATTRDKVTGAISWTLVPRVLQLIVSLFTSILIVRTLGKFDYGTLSVLRTVLVLVVVLCGFGLGQAINRFIPELRVTDQRAAGRGLLYRSLLLQSALWFALSLVLLILRSYLRAHYPTYGDLLILGVGLSLAEVTAGTMNQYAVASYRTREMALATALGSLVLAVGTALLLHLGLRVAGVLVATAAGFGANTLLLMALLRPKGALTPPEGAQPGKAPPDRDPGRPAPSGFPWRRMLAYALPWVPNNVLNFVVWRQSETLLLGIFRSRVEAGFFDLAYKLPQLVLEFLPGSVYPLVLAGFAETATVAREKMGDVITTYYRLLFFVVAPLSLLGLAMGDVLLARMYGQSMAQAGHYCQAFFVIFALSFFGTPLSMTVYVVERVWINLVLNIGYAVVTVGLDLLLIPRWGLLGATIPTAFVTAITPFVRYAIARRYLDRIVIPWAFIGRAYLASTPLLLLFWAKAWVHSLGGLALILLASAAVALASYRIFRVLGPVERDFLERSHIPAKSWILRIL